MAIFAVPLGMPVKRPFVTTLKARGSAALSHEAEDLVVFSPRLYKRMSPHSIAERKKSMTHLDQNPDPPVEGSEYRDHTHVRRTDPFKKVKPFFLPDALVNILVLRRMWA